MPVTVSRRAEFRDTGSAFCHPQLHCRRQRLDRSQIRGQRFVRDRQIVVRLQVQPELGFHAEENTQAGGGIGGDAALVGDDFPDSSMASTISSSLQQISMSFELACGLLIAGGYLGDLPQTGRVAVTSTLHYAFLTLGGLTMLSSLSFWSLRPGDGESASPKTKRSKTHLW